MQPWWRVQCNPISTREFIVMLSSGTVGWFCDPDTRWKDKSKNLIDGAERRWHQNFHFPIILGLKVWPSSIVILSSCFPSKGLKIQAMTGHSPHTSEFYYYHFDKNSDCHVFLHLNTLLVLHIIYIESWLLWYSKFDFYFLAYCTFF